MRNLPPLPLPPLPLCAGVGAVVSHLLSPLAVTTLTAAHLFVTGLGLHFAAKCMRAFEPKTLDVK